MTKGTPKSPMELDLDALLQSHATTSDTDSDDDGPNSIHRRTVDEILNNSSSSSSSSSSPSSSPVRRLHPLLSPKPIPPTKIQIPETRLPIPPILTADESIRSPHYDDVAYDLKTATSTTGRVVKPTEFSISPFTLGRSYPRPLPPLFGGVKPNPKPGAALAAAAAASRSIPTPHAAAIKFRRASSSDLLLKPVDRQESVGVDDSEDFERLGLAPDDASIPVGSETMQSDDKLVKKDDRVENLESLMIESNSAQSAEILHDSDESQAIQENQAEETEALQVDEEDLVDYNHSLDNEIHIVSDSTDVFSENSGAVENSTIFNSTTVVEERIPSAPQDQEAYWLEVDSTFPISDKHDLDANMFSDHRDGEDANSRSDVTEIFEDISIQLESKRLSKKSSKKLRSSLKPLELAEELEKKLASSGLHWEEGAAAQPMRLEGIRRGPPAVGYLQIDPDNAITRMISSQAFRRDHGSAQVVSVHTNFIAVGMSKGTVFIVPSKYSPHHADNMDTKITMLGSLGEKSHSPVTSMCFNQQADLLLVGYGDGRLTIWDVQRGTTIKTITGEHTAPVVYILFLGQDSQVTRQIKAVTGDCKGLVLLHTFSVVPLLNRFSIKTQCLLDGQKGSVVLSASALLIDDLHGAGLTSAHGSATASPSGLGSMVGGVVGVVGGDAGWKLFSEGSSLVEEGVVIFVTNQTALVVRLTPSFQVYTQLVKPDGVREGSTPYTAWKYVTYSRGSSTGMDQFMLLNFRSHLATGRGQLK